MAVPPSVPTSFVPRTTPPSVRRGVFDFGGAFAFIGYGAFALALLMAAGIFAYEWYLESVEGGARKELQEAQSAIDAATVESFVRLNDRLIEGKRIIERHPMTSAVFDLVEKLTPASVRLASLSLSFTDARIGIVSAKGTASSFNALAALSAALGRDGRIKDAVFSDISVEQGGVSFTLSAATDLALTAFVATALLPTSAPEEPTAPLTP
ncbi:hypothetical protein A3H77_01795 [Candidatus Kaiserbacteria bacterium RIFCSPLOWO2_02_FULL_56_11]|nr:MAG: hypothetical protein A3H77_01795 [Candidatus Kaiserbacteria bacterium RIFCSPLOWO2_02_FULL_56_11]